MKGKTVLFLSILTLFWMSVVPVGAQEGVEEKPEQEQGLLDGILKALGDAAKDSMQEGIDDFIGTYKGRIGEVKLLERRGNAVVLEVRYKDVKRQDGVYVQGEVLEWGQPLEGFSSTLTPISEEDGSVRLTIGRKSADDTGWGTSAAETTSDQIRLSLVRESHPERPFGSLVYDIQKTWTDSSDIELPPEPAETEAGVELAEGETAEEGSTGGSGNVYQPGLVLTPRLPSAAGQPATADDRPSLQRVPAKHRPIINDYNFFANARNAVWNTSAGELRFPGANNDRRGFVRTLNSGMVCPNNRANNLLQTHPQWINGGWIEGRYPPMRLGQNLKFKTVGALLKGADRSDSVVMRVFIETAGEPRRQLIRKRINNKKYLNLEADLSPYAGKTVQIVMRVEAGRTSTQDWAVWVNPRLAQN